jgi:ketosteroid isomerase-like protein
MVDTKKLMDEINSTMRSVNDSFVRGDVKTYVSHYHMPIIHADPQHGVMLWNNAQETEKIIQGMVEGLRAEGWRNSAIADRKITLMSENLALLTSTVHRYDARGNVLQSMGVTYNLVKKEGNWKLYAITAHAPGYEPK